MLADERRTHTFVWQGMDWTGGIVLGQLAWLLGAVAIAPVAALPSTASIRRGVASGSPGAARPRPGKMRRRPTARSRFSPVPVALTPLTPQPPGARRFGGRGFVRLLVAEHAAAAPGAALSGGTRSRSGSDRHLAAPLAIARGGVPSSPSPGSGRCSSGRRWGTGKRATRPAASSSRRPNCSAASSPPPGAGALLAMATGGAARPAPPPSPTTTRGSAPGRSAARCSSPPLALALGVWSGGGKLFEVVYLVFWYLGLDAAPAGDGLPGRRAGDGRRGDAARSSAPRGCWGWRRRWEAAAARAGVRGVRTRTPRPWAALVAAASSPREASPSVPLHTWRGTRLLRTGRARRLRYAQRWEC